MKSIFSNIGTDFPVLLFLALLLWRIRRTDGEMNSFVSQEDGLPFRGIAALIVLLHHLSLSTEHGILMRMFPLVGAGGLGVALFFFLSGYGLQKQYMENGKTYRQNFLKKRFPSILIPFALFTVLYWLVYYSLGKIYTFHDMISDIRVGIPFVAYSWYLIAILFFYLLFWIFMNIFRERNIQWMPVVACGWYLLYALICIRLKFLIFWYDTAHLLPVGMFCAVHEKKLLNALSNRALYIALMITAVFGWLLSTYVYAYIWPISIKAYYILSLARVFFFTVMVILLRFRIQTDNPALRYLGKISLEIYLIHGLIFYLLRGDYCDLANEPLFCFLSLSSVILIASILSPIDRFLVRSWKQAVK